jgi:hypothetical protein
LNYWAVSDLAANKLAEFGEKFEADKEQRRGLAQLQFADRVLRIQISNSTDLRTL